VVPNTAIWVTISAIALALAAGGSFLLMNPQYENPRNPFLGPVLVFTAMMSTVLVIGVSLLDLVAVQYSASALALKLRSGRIIRTSWQNVGDCNYYPENRGFSLSLIGRAFGWRTRLEEPVGADLVRLFKSSRRG